MTPFLGTGFVRDEVDRVVVGLSLLLLDVDEFARGFCWSESSGLFDRRERLSTGMVCNVAELEGDHARRTVVEGYRKQRLCRGDQIER